MKLNNFIYFVIVLFIASTGVYAEEISVKQINNLLLEIDRLSANKDVEGIGNYLSDDIEITMHVSILGNLQTHKADKKQYLEQLTQGWSIAKDYKYSRDNVEIKILKNSTEARVTATVYESMVIEETPISSTSNEAITLEKRDGKILITRMTGETTI